MRQINYGGFGILAKLSIDMEGFMEGLEFFLLGSWRVYDFMDTYC